LSARRKRSNSIKQPFSRLPQIKRDVSDFQSSTETYRYLHPPK